MHLASSFVFWSFCLFRLRHLRVDVLSGFSWMLFSYTFTTPGVYTFGSQQSPWSNMVLKVVDATKEGEGACPSFTDFPQPPSSKIFKALDISVRHTVTRAPNWCLIFSVTLLLFVFIFFVTAVLLRYFRKWFWVYPEADKTSKQKQAANAPAQRSGFFLQL